MTRVRTIAVCSLAIAGIVSGLSSGNSGTLPADEGPVEKIQRPELAAELRSRFESDQAIRREWIDFGNKHKTLGENVDLEKRDPSIVEKHKSLQSKVADEDRKNRIWLKDVVQQHGWPGKTLVGTSGAHYAWLLVQHADQDRAFQQDCLAKMEALPKGEVSSIDIAYLTDRILSGTGKKQKYGTQAAIKNGRPVPNPIEDEEHVDERRKAIGLEPLADYLNTLAKIYGLSNTTDSK